MGCGEALVKYILFFTNIFFALAGLTLLGLGVAIQLKAVSAADLGFSLAPISSMVLGSFVFIVAFFGCCGAIRESNCMLVMYAILMLLLMILKITLATVIFVNMDSILNEVPGFLNKTFNNDREAFHNIEQTFQCCGPTGAGSYFPNVTLPESCCASSITVPCTAPIAFGGCETAMKDFLNTFGLIIGIVAIAVGAIELVAVVFGLCLASHVRNKSRRARY